MLDAKNCPHRGAFTPARIQDVPIMTCALVNSFLGWMHGFSESFCERCCLAQAADFPVEFLPGRDDALNFLAKAALTSRLRDGRSDDDPTNPWRSGSWQHCSRELAVEKAKSCGIKNETIANALVVAVERGFPADKATEIAKQHAVVA